MLRLLVDAGRHNELKALRKLLEPAGSDMARLAAGFKSVRGWADSLFKLYVRIWGGTRFFGGWTPALKL